LLEPIGGSRSMGDEALHLVRQWQFRPVEKDGKPAIVESVLTLKFPAAPVKTEQP
jgi:outer membrane biosynthesis protein TonB